MESPDAGMPASGAFVHQIGPLLGKMAPFGANVHQIGPLIGK
jgi:hypothetical protein